MENKEQLPQQPDYFQQEEKILKALRNLRRACVMRVAVLGILVFALATAGMESWVVGLMVLVMGITFAGMLPLVQEWKKQRRSLKALRDAEDAKYQ